MAKKTLKTLFIKIRPGTDKEQLALDIFCHCLSKKNSFSRGELDKCMLETGNFSHDYVNLCIKRGLMKAEGDLLRLNKDHKKLLGVGFRSGRCHISLVDMEGNILKKEDFPIEFLLKGKNKNKDISGIVGVIKENTKMTGNDLAATGVAIPEEIAEVNPKSIDILSKGVADIFKSPVYATMSSTASGYGDREFSQGAKETDVLYMYSDVGTGVIFKKEHIFEADEYSDEKYGGAYLRPWNQFSIVNATKSLVSKGVGTDIVEMVKGDIDNITLDVVFEAAKNKDEMAEDLVKRSGLALGVRVAYLVKMFNVDFILFGGGIENTESRFVEYVKESMGKFIPDIMLNKLKIVPGVLGRESSSIGAALLCRREIFMEV